MEMSYQYRASETDAVNAAHLTQSSRSFIARQQELACRSRYCLAVLSVSITNWVPKFDGDGARPFGCRGIDQKLAAWASLGYEIFPTHPAVPAYFLKSPTPSQPRNSLKLFPTLSKTRVNLFCLSVIYLGSFVSNYCKRLRQN